MSATRRVLVVRHGESTWNAVRRWQGRADPPLSDRGESQARNAARVAPRHGPFAAVATSTLQRARRTGEVIAEGLGTEPLEGIDHLSERSAGEWEGLTRAEIEQRYPGYLADDRRPPGYEADDSVVARATAALDDLAQYETDGPILVVSHGGVIHALERAALGDGGWMRLDNLAGRWFVHDGDLWRPDGERVALVPDGGPAIPPPSSPEPYA